MPKKDIFNISSNNEFSNYSNQVTKQPLEGSSQISRTSVY